MLTPGLHVTVPIVDNVKFKMCLSVMSHVVEDQVWSNVINARMRALNFSH